MFSHMILGAAQGSTLYVGDMLFYAILFVVLMALIAKFAWGPVNAMLKERADRISNDIESAEQAKKEAQKLAEQRKEALDNSHAEATTIINNAKNSGAKERELIVGNAQVEAKSLKDKAKQDIEQERADALKSAQDDIASLSIEIASKVIKKELDENSQKELIDSYIEGLGESK
ncbi:F0F1 ATP synthase subunit B [Pediococcus acidilactici]|uniref:F0F1 ATP synthase subunit B n=1 Tax=Pediococcus acidilactici TaxID=1254 RepID=UPI0020CFDC80|nr:F0F1 ATP synthase subunit B [Pediococcus acidilactici]MCQ0077325.1 ATP synthase F0 subunit B [Pediococcus acidilactici]